MSLSHSGGNGPPVAHSVGTASGVSDTIGKAETVYPPDISIETVETITPPPSGSSAIFVCSL